MNYADETFGHVSANFEHNIDITVLYEKFYKSFFAQETFSHMTSEISTCLDEKLTSILHTKTDMCFK